MISIEPAIIKLMSQDAIQTFPDECCGFLFGEEDQQGNRVINDLMVVNNASTENRKRRFEIAPKDYLKAEQFALEKNKQLIGVYHSHPNHPAIPSEHDRVAAQPYFSYIIISVTETDILEVRSWLLNEQGQFEEELIVNPKFHHTNN